MGVFQRYTKKNKDGDIIIGKNKKPVKEGPWFVQFPFSRDPATGKIKYLTKKASFSKKKAEKIFRAKVDAFQEMEQFGVQVDSEITFYELMKWGLNQEVMKNKASARDDKTRLKHLVDELGTCKAGQIKPLMVDNFRVKMIRTVSKSTGKNYAGGSINKMISLARRIYNLAIDAEIIKTNPFAKRGVFKEKAVGQHIPNHEFWRIHKHLRDYLKPIATVGYLTGMRRTEILDLVKNRVNLKEGFIDLTPDDTKTDEPRRIYFNSIKILKDVFIETTNTRHKGQDLVFTKEDGSAVPKHYIHRLFKQACKKAGVGPYRFHDLRHTFNTNMLKAGVDQVVTMKLTGHKTNAMFLRYSHIDKEQSEGAMKKLNGFLETMGNRVESVSGM